MTDHPTTEPRPDDPRLYQLDGMKPQCSFIYLWHRCRLDAGHGGLHSPGRAAALPAQEPLDVPRLADRGVLEQACIAVVGPWFDESHERGRFAPMELAQRILREYDARLRDEEERP